MASGALLSPNSLIESTPEEVFAAPTETNAREDQSAGLNRSSREKPTIKPLGSTGRTSESPIVMRGTAGTSALPTQVNDFNLSNTYEYTRQLFSLLMQARGDYRKQIYEILLHQAEPAILLSVALSEYHLYGNEDRCTLAASLLTDIGARGLPALHNLARSNLPECELFADVIAYLRGVSVRDRLESLAYLVRNPSVHVRHSLLEALEAFTPQEATPLLRILSDDKDDDLAKEARARLESPIA